MDTKTGAPSSDTDNISKAEMEAITDHRFDPPNIDRREENLTAFLAIAIPAALIDLWLWLVALPNGMPVIAIVAAHLLVLLLCYLGILLYYRRGWDMRFCATLAVMGTILGPFGLVIGVLTAISYKIFATRQLDSKELLEELLPEFQEHPIAEASHRLRTGLDKVEDNTTPVPFLDVMGFGSMEQKRAVIGVTLRYFTPELTEVLRVGLRDNTNSIRVLSATAMVALEEKYYARLVELQQQVEKHPDDMDTLLDYAKHSSSFALSNILGDERSARMRGLSIHAYEILCSSSDASEETAVGLARLLLANDEPEKAMLVLAPWAENEQTMTIDVLNYYGEALFRLRRLGDLRLFARQGLRMITDFNAASDETRSILTLWAGKDYHE